MVTGEDAQATGVLRQHRGDAELRGEVGDRLRGRALRIRLGGLALVPAVTVEVAVEVRPGQLDHLEELAVARELGQPLAADGAQEPHRVTVRGLPEIGVHRPEDVLRLGVPRPAQVDREIGQRGQRLGEDRTDGESTDCSHRTTVAHSLWIDPMSRLDRCPRNPAPAGAFPGHDLEHIAAGIPAQPARHGCRGPGGHHPGDRTVAAPGGGRDLARRPRRPPRT